jgi:hypothetical protein
VDSLVIDGEKMTPRNFNWLLLTLDVGSITILNGRYSSSVLGTPVWKKSGKNYEAAAPTKVVAIQFDDGCLHPIAASLKLILKAV